MKGSLSAGIPTRDFNAENAFESNSTMDVENDVHNPVVNKKKIRATTPTSEQLASLNLKEGRNVVTFTFSTAMLGEQQVICCCVFFLGLCVCVNACYWK